MKKSTIIGSAFILTILTFAGLWRLTDHDLDRRQSEAFVFTSGDVSISGTLWLPDTPPVAAVVFVHGDGPQDRTSQGSYAPLINVFLDRGIAVAAWDKPGVGGSEGNWLLQSMADRTLETRAALAQLALRFDNTIRGAVGFSQAGWVLPSLTAEDADFIVLIGAAVSWHDQGKYFTRMRLASENLDSIDIEETLAKRENENERTFGPSALSRNRPEGMSLDRWIFIRENRTADARNALSHLSLPLFAIWGADDLNVDAQRDAEIYSLTLAHRDIVTEVVIWPDATHGLLKSPPYNWQLTEEWSWFAMARFLAEGRHAFAPGAIETITDWIHDLND